MINSKADINQAQSGNKKKLRQVAIITIKLLLTLLILYFLSRNLWDNWDQVKDFEWQVDIPIFILSLVVAQLGFFMFAFCWRLIISAFGHQISPLKSFKIANLSNLGRYIPGKVWQVFGMLYLAKKEGIGELQAGASFVLIQLFTIPASILVFLLAAQFEPSIFIDKFAILGQGSAYLIGGIALFGCLLLIFHPTPFIRLANMLLKRLGRDEIDFSLDKSVALWLFSGYFGGWILSGVAFWLFLRSILGDSAPSAIASIGLYNAAYQIGYLALFAPGGLGVREGVIGLLLQPFLGPLGLAVALVARIWAIIIDSIAALLALAVKD